MIQTTARLNILLNFITFTWRCFLIICQLFPCHFQQAIIVWWQQLYSVWTCTSGYRACLHPKTNPEAKAVNKALTIYLVKWGQKTQTKGSKTRWVDDRGQGTEEETTQGGWRRRREASQYGGTLHNSLAVLIYRLADLAPSQYAIAFVIFELEPRRRERGRERDLDGEGR